MTASPTQARHDVAIVGGGVVGLAIAWRAAAQGARVVVLERGRVGCGASRVAAGMLAPVAEAEVGNAGILRQALEAAARWPAFSDELSAAAGVPPLLRRSGTLLVARDRDEAEALERELAFRRDLGLAVERLLASRARRLEPGLAPGIRLALDVPDDHSADPRAVVAALRVAAERAGARVREGAEVVGLEPGAARLAGGDVVAARRLVLAAGAWSGQLAGVPVHPVKGQVIRLRDPRHGEQPPLLERVLRFEGGYLVPRGDGRYVLGATVEERGFDTTVTAGAVHELLRCAGELVPGVWELVVEEALAGLRPGTPDNLPIVAPSDEVEGMVVATGHFRNGVLLAPLTADLVVEALALDEVAV